MTKIALVPIDNRPVCYTLPIQLTQIDSNIQFEIPKRELLGDLNNKADYNSILQWLSSIEDLDAIILSLDTMAYGGLIPSRRSNDTTDEIKTRLFKLKNILKNSPAKIYAFSSIMRISNNDVNEEEKEYWDIYGKKIFEYSFKFHREGKTETSLPTEIIEDYLSTRARNFEINRLYLDWLEEGIFSTLIFSKDDCAEFGLNVMEAEKLQNEIKSKNLQGQVKTGADEIPLSLLARAVCDVNKEKMNLSAPKISVEFIEPEFKNLISNYEDISIENSVLGQIELVGAKIEDIKNSDIHLLINNFKTRQGEIVMNIETAPFNGELSFPDKPFAIADVRFANGADNSFVDKLLGKKIDLDKFFGYSAWNTSANSLGSLICAMIIRFYAKSYDQKAFINLQLIRFLDDWAYQANTRQILKASSQDLAKLTELMNPYEQVLSEKFNCNCSPKYSFPWDRFFEIEVTL